MVPLPGNQRTPTTQNLANQLATIAAQLEAILASLRDDVEEIKVQIYGDGMNTDAGGVDVQEQISCKDNVQEQISCKDLPIDIKKLDKTDVNITVTESYVKETVEKGSLQIIEEEKKDVSKTVDYSPPSASISALSPVSISKSPFLFAVASVPPALASLQPMTTKLPRNTKQGSTPSSIYNFDKRSKTDSIDYPSRESGNQPEGVLAQTEWRSPWIFYPFDLGTSRFSR